MQPRGSKSLVPDPCANGTNVPCKEEVILAKVGDSQSQAHCVLQSVKAAYPRGRHFSAMENTSQNELLGVPVGQVCRFRQKKREGKLYSFPPPGTMVVHAGGSHWEAEPHGGTIPHHLMEQLCTDPSGSSHPVGAIRITAEHVNVSRFRAAWFSEVLFHCITLKAVATFSTTGGGTILPLLHSHLCNHSFKGP